jgi:hypothetical protein
MLNQSRQGFLRRVDEALNRQIGGQRFEFAQQFLFHRTFLALGSLRLFSRDIHTLADQFRPDRPDRFADALGNSLDALARLIAIHNRGGHFFGVVLLCFLGHVSISYSWLRFAFRRICITRVATIRQEKKTGKIMRNAEK